MQALGYDRLHQPYEVLRCCYWKPERNRSHHARLGDVSLVATEEL